jgi:2-polyprenyl-3-methyl-5-hydroxy-6-metoxy-1,4-benzoquinol methylase
MTTLSVAGQYYDGLLIQAGERTHQLATSYAKAHFAPGTPVLDVASGTGALAKRMSDCGLRVSCTSWNGRCAESLTTYKLDLDHKFAVADVGGAPYPLVTAIEIIEHLENPAQFLRSLREIMAPDGRLILSTPNVECVAARLQWLVRGCPYIFEVDEVKRNRHISMMWRQGLEHLIWLAGFDIVERHFVEDADPPKTARGYLKRALYWAVSRCCRGELSGSTRLYVLRRSERPVKIAGPDDVH